MQRFSSRREAAIDLGARRVAILVQTDTYFHSPHGRLKLREIGGVGEELIWYDRPNTADFHASDYYVVPVSDASRVNAVLTASMGVRVQVRKCRELLMLENVRIHLDQVDELGSFVEFEAVLEESDDENLSVQRLAKLQLALTLKQTTGST